MIQVKPIIQKIKKEIATELIYKEFEQYFKIPKNSYIWSDISNINLKSKFKTNEKVNQFINIFGKNLDWIYLLQSNIISEDLLHKFFKTILKQDPDTDCFSILFESQNISEQFLNKHLTDIIKYLKYLDSVKLKNNKSYIINSILQHVKISDNLKQKFKNL